ncbi:MAG: DNA-deoxyinosine glycosylase, partial [Christensenella sp.]
MKSKTEKLTHPFGAEFDAYSKILILGTFPSVKSRENMFYYGNPRNRFFKVLSALFNEEMPGDIPQKKAFLHKHHIAVFDVLRSCEICGSADTSIKQPVPNDFSEIFREANICAVFT